MPLQDCIDGEILNQRKSDTVYRLVLEGGEGPEALMLYSGRTLQKHLCIIIHSIQKEDNLFCKGQKAGSQVYPLFGGSVVSLTREKMVFY